jgi:hypothetical protein
MAQRLPLSLLPQVAAVAVQAVVGVQAQVAAAVQAQVAQAVVAAMALAAVQVVEAVARRRLRPGRAKSPKVCL